jgi:hypothetical protein
MPTRSLRAPETDMALLQALYTAVVCIDFEFHQPAGERPAPLCMATYELFSQRTSTLWFEAPVPQAPPWPTTPDVLMVTFYGSAELSCYQALGWPFPSRVIDLYAEFRNLASGLPVPGGYGLLGALEAFGLPGMASAEKVRMQHLAQRGGPFTPRERDELLLYCETDVRELASLLQAMIPLLNLKYALLRGRYLHAVARIEWEGIPCDTAMLGQLQTHWHALRGKLMHAVNQTYGVFVPRHLSLDPETPFGAAVLALAAEYEVDPYALAVAANQVWHEHQDLYRETVAARRLARQRTGLTPAAMSRWERAGHDGASWPHLDEQAEELAWELPTLGLGTDAGERNGSTAADRLWDMLHETEERAPHRYDGRMLREAAARVMRQPEGWLEDGPLRFSAERLEAYLIREQIPWPRLPSGALAQDDATYREMARAYPQQIGPLRDIRYTLSQLRLHELAVGRDGRNRCLLSVFGSTTGRNQPSNSKYIFGPSTWLRSLIQPGPGRAVAYIDWSAQELAIAAYLSGDAAMQECYHSSDPYLTFAKMAGAAPVNATKATHPAVRDRFKIVALGVLYGLTESGIARRLTITPCEARRLLRQHKQIFRHFWAWSEFVEIEGMLGGHLRTAFGWQVHAGPDPNPRSLRNFPMQASGSDMMRLACCLATERGLAVCGVVHDALLIEASCTDIDAATARTQQAMEDASMLVLPDFRVRTEQTIVRYPDRFQDPRGVGMWEMVQNLLTEIREEVPF